MKAGGASLAVLLVLAWGGAGCGGSQSASPATTEAEPPRIDRGFPGAFSADTDNLFYLRDVLPHIKAVLTSPRTKKALDEVLSLVRKEEGNNAYTLQTALALVNQYKEWIPRQVAIGIDSTVWTYLDTLVRGTATVIVTDDHANAPAALGDTLADLKFPRTTLWVQMRTESSARNLFDEARNLADSAGIPALRTTAQSIEFKGTLGTPPLGLGLQLAIARLGWDDGEMDLVGALGSLPLRAELSLHGDALQLVLDGGQPAKHALSTAGLGKLYSAAPSLLSWAGWNAAPMASVLAGWTRDMAPWLATKRGSEFSHKARNILDELAYWTKHTTELPLVGEQSAVVRDGGMTVRMLERGGTPAQPLAASGITRYIPASADAVHIDGLGSLGAAVLERFAKIEDKFSNDALKEKLAGKDGIEQQLGTAYEQAMGPVHGYILSTATAAFKPPYAFIGRHRGRITRLAATSPFGDIEVRNVGVPEFALIGKVSTPALATQFVQGLYSHLVSALGIALDTKLTTVGLAAEVDYQLGVPTQRLTGSWIPGPPFGVNIAVDGDAQVHQFVLGDYLVVSSSPSLSRAIVAAASKKASGKAPELASNVVRMSRFDSASLVDLIREGDSWATQLRADRSFKAWVAAFAKVAPLIGEHRLITTEESGVRNTIWNVRWP